MEKIESSFKVLSTSDIEKNSQETKSYVVPVSREKQEYIKKLMFQALEDPRKKYTPTTMDDVEAYWRNPDGC
jgi:hypothetical protein